MLNQPLAKLAIDNGGRITPLIIPASLTDGTGLMNPSIIFHEDKTIVILRHVNYTIYHSEKKKFLHEWGPLVYLHPEHYQKLKTTNYYCEIDDKGLVSKNLVVDTSLLDVEPLWEFVGLEDARIVYWDNKMYLSGVRRDTTTNGQGRIELSELAINNYSVKEIKRYRIEPPRDKNSYCEKNWMPVLDKPFHYVKWTNPTELVKVDIDTLSSEQIFLGEQKTLYRDLRGGSQVIPWKNYYITITHEVDLFNDSIGRKDGIYRHRIILWDRNFVKIGWSDDFSFLGGDIEFCAGMAFKDNHFYITFGFQDNSACLLKVPENIIEGLLNL